MLLVLVVTRGEPATAQQTAADGMATHPVVGTWRFVKDFGVGPTVSFGIFHADGTYIQEGYVDGPIEFGAWQPTGERTADLRVRHLYLWDDKVVDAEARYAITVDETDKTLEGPIVYVSRYLDDGTIEYTSESTMTGTRITAAPLVSLAELITETEPQVSPVP
jgi:hypothetical protein